MMAQHEFWHEWNVDRKRKPDTGPYRDTVWRVYAWYDDCTFVVPRGDRKADVLVEWEGLQALVIVDKQKASAVLVRANLPSNG